jgi:hypothetical protein
MMTLHCMFASQTILLSELKMIIPFVSENPTFMHLIAIISYIANLSKRFFLSTQSCLHQSPS